MSHTDIGSFFFTKPSKLSTTFLEQVFSTCSLCLEHSSCRHLWTTLTAYFRALLRYHHLIEVPSPSSSYPLYYALFPPWLLLPYNLIYACPFIICPFHRHLCCTGPELWQSCSLLSHPAPRRELGTDDVKVLNKRSTYAGYETLSENLQKRRVSVFPRGCPSLLTPHSCLRLLENVSGLSSPLCKPLASPHPALPPA